MQQDTSEMGHERTNDLLELLRRETIRRDAAVLFTSIDKYYKLRFKDLTWMDEGAAVP